MTTDFDNFRNFFKVACGQDRIPYQYQCRLACGQQANPGEPSTLIQGRACESLLIDIPTGLGKTAAVVLAWLWNRVAHPDLEHRKAWPRRLVYCLPMRTLVEQTKKVATDWSCAVFPDDNYRPAVHILMGGEEYGDWDFHPERNAILIGTQDMLLSRALNRGYGMSRARWPMSFGLLNNDCLWVFDEVQLMGSGLPTTAQLEAFRHQFPPAKACHTWWMSATSENNWLKTVDFDPTRLGLPIQLSEEEKESVKDLLQAHKPVSKAKSNAANPKALAREIFETSRDSQGITLVVINTVKRARALWQEINKLYGKQSEVARPLLLHSRFRPEDRMRILGQVLAAESTPRIIVSTQVIEAGVDLSAATLFTELASWTSLVQRFGRCNRRGKEKSARIVWIDTDNSAPYSEDQLAEAKKRLLELEDKSASPGRLSTIPIPAVDRPLAQQVIRRKDFLELFDTTPDLAGNDLDIDRWVREVEESSVQIFWRKWEGDARGHAPDTQEVEFSAPHRHELCPVPIKEFRDFVFAKNNRKNVWRWDFLDGRWSRVRDEATIYPGQTYLLPASAGGYSPATGWDPTIKDQVEEIPPRNDQGDLQPLETNDSDELSEREWQTIAEHTDLVCAKLTEILDQCPASCEALPLAARWHDWGKSHEFFQKAIQDNHQGAPRPKLLESREVAKAPRKWWTRYDRRHFRHELASALGVLHPNTILDPNRSVSPEERDLIAYLVAAHHGKVRLSIRSLPGEREASEGNRFARGIWQGDELPVANLGGGIISPKLTLSLEPMELGLCQEAPFEGQPSWAERTLRLRDTHGPFRLAYWEALLRAADMRASRKETP